MYVIKYNKTNMNCCKKHYCPVCMEEKHCGIRCKICNNTKICTSCITKLCEEGQINKCPICRQENWKEEKCITKIFPKSMKNCKIIMKPRGHVKYFKDKTANSCPSTYDIYKCIVILLFIIKRILECIIVLLFIYTIGLFGLLLVSSQYFNDDNKTVVHFMLPFIVGICSLFTCGGVIKCCCRKEDYYD